MAQKLYPLPPSTWGAAVEIPLEHVSQAALFTDFAGTRGSTYVPVVLEANPLNASWRVRVHNPVSAAGHLPGPVLGEISPQWRALFDETESRGEVNFGAGYTLELTTPGVDLPLTEARHFRRNRGRTVTVCDERWRLGPLDDAEEHVALVRAGKRGPEIRVSPVSELAGAVVEIEFNAPPAAETELTEQAFAELEAAAAAQEGK